MRCNAFKRPRLTCAISGKRYFESDYTIKYVRTAYIEIARIFPDKVHSLPLQAALAIESYNRLRMRRDHSEKLNSEK